MGLLTTAAAAEYLGVRERQVRELRHRRELPAIAVGGLIRYDERDLAAFIAANRSPALHGALAESVPARPARRRTNGARS